jgi:hypothetical protein
MTQLRLITSPPDGHGFTSKMLDRIYADLTSGRDLGGQYLVVGIVTPATTSQRRTAKGIHRFVGAEFVRLEVIHDSELAEQCRFALAKAYENRTGGRQLSLEYDGAPEIEKRRQLFEAFADYRREQDPPLTEDELTAEWRAYIQPTEGAPVPAMAHAPTQHLHEFALYCGALVDEKVANQPALPAADSPTAVRPVPEALFDNGQGGEGDEPTDQADDGEPVGEPAEPEQPEGSIEAAAEDAAKDRGGLTAVK